MGKLVLANQFVNGLIPELKAKLLERKVMWNNYWLMHALRKLSSMIQDHLRGTLVSNQYNHSFDQHIGLVVDTGLKVRLQPEDDSCQHSLMVSKVEHNCLKGLIPTAIVIYNAIFVDGMDTWPDTVNLKLQEDNRKLEDHHTNNHLEIR